MLSARKTEPGPRARGGVGKLEDGLEEHGVALAARRIEQAAETLGERVDRSKVRVREGQSSLQGPQYHR